MACDRRLDYKKQSAVIKDCPSLGKVDLAAPFKVKPTAIFGIRQEFSPKIGLARTGEANAFLDSMGGR